MSIIIELYTSIIEDIITSLLFILIPLTIFT